MHACMHALPDSGRMMVFYHYTEHTLLDASSQGLLPASPPQDCQLTVVKPNPRQYVAEIAQASPVCSV